MPNADFFVYLVELLERDIVSHIAGKKDYCSIIYFKTGI